MSKSLTIKKLTPKQQKFCDEYLIDLNGTQAAIRAGYSKKTAFVIANENLNKPNIKEYLTIRQDNAQERNELTLDRVLQEIALIALQDPRTMFDKNSLKDITDLDEDTARVLAEVTVRREKSQDGDANVVETVKLKTYDKTKALDMLMKHLGGYEKDNKQKETPILFIERTIIK